MEFNGRQDLIHPEKLPEGFALTDQNSRRRTRSIWTPRQGLSRPQTVGKQANRIESIGYGECALKTALLIEHGGSIEGFAIGKTTVTPVWLPPPPRTWFYEVPTLIVLQTGDGEVTLTPSSTNSYIVIFNFFRDGVLIGTGTTLTDTPGAGTFDYTVIAETETGIQSDESARTRHAVFGTFISDNFNRANGVLGSPWQTVSGLTMLIESNQIRAQGDPGGVVAHSTALALPVSASMDCIVGGALSSGTPQWALGITPDGDPTHSGADVATGFMRYISLSDVWEIGISSLGVTSSAQFAGQPPNGTLVVTVSVAGLVTVTYAGVSASRSMSGTPSTDRQIVPQITTATQSAIMFMDNFAAGGTTP